MSISQYGNSQMKLRDYTFEPLEILDRVCDAYGFHQKIQLAHHFGISSSSLSNRYTRGTLSYDFAAICSLETGISLKWLLTGEGERTTEQPTLSEISDSQIKLKKFTLSDGQLTDEGSVSIERHFFRKPPVMAEIITSEGKSYFIEKKTPLSDGTWLIDIDGSVSIRELALLPARKVHVTGGKVPFECGINELTPLGRVVGIYAEVN